MESFALLQTLTSAFGPSGQEKEAAAAISALAAPYADEIFTDTMGNLIVHKRGSGPRLMVAAHMDTIALVATYFEEDGTLRFGKLGGISPKEIRNAPFRFQNGVAGTVKVHGKAEEDKLALDDLYLDIGAGSREEAQSMVKLGDAAVYATAAMRAGNRVISPYLDNRASCAAVLMTLERLKKTAYDLYIVFTVQEELGLRGAKTAAYAIDPQYAIAVDVTGAYDYPGAPRAGSAVLGGGAAIKIMDSSLICHPDMIKQLTSLAQKQGLHTQQDVLTRGGTDAGAIHQSRSGVITGGISIPCRYSHTPTAVIDMRDVEDCICLLTTFIEIE